MWALAVKVIEFVSGGAFAGIAKGVTDVLNKRADVDLGKTQVLAGAERDVQLAAVQAQVAEYHEQNQLAQLRWGWWGTRYLLMLAAIPPIIHSGAIYLDSTFKFGWGIARAPGVYEGQELKIIAIVVGYQLGQTAVGGFITRMKK